MTELRLVGCSRCCWLGRLDSRRYGLVVLVQGHAHVRAGLQIGSLAGLSIAGHFGILCHRVTVFITLAAGCRELVASHFDNFAFMGTFRCHRHKYLLEHGIGSSSDREVRSAQLVVGPSLVRRRVYRLTQQTLLAAGVLHHREAMFFAGATHLGALGHDFVVRHLFAGRCTISTALHAAIAGVHSHWAVTCCQGRGEAASVSTTETAFHRCGVALLASRHLGAAVLEAGVARRLTVGTHLDERRTLGGFAVDFGNLLVASWGRKQESRREKQIREHGKSSPEFRKRWSKKSDRYARSSTVAEPPWWDPATCIEIDCGLTPTQPLLVSDVMDRCYCLPPSFFQRAILSTLSDELTFAFVVKVSVGTSFARR